MGTVWNMNEGMVYIYLTIYYRYISKNWIPTLIFAISLQSLTILLIVLWVPESPRWLYNTK